MTAEQLLSYVTQGAFAFIFCTLVVEAARTRRRLVVDAALFFGTIVAISAMGLSLRFHLFEPSEFVSDVQSMLLLLLPYLQLRMIDDFGRVPRPMFLAGQGISMATILSLFLVPRPYSAAYVIAIVLCFSLVQGYSTWRLIVSVRGSTGVRRGRTQALALASAMLVVVLVVAVLARFFPAERVLWRVLSSSTALACGLGYFVGFTPPRPMRQLWEAPVIREFLSRISQIPSELSSAALATELEEAVATAIGSQHALLTVWDEDRRRLVPLHEMKPDLPTRREARLGQSASPSDATDGQHETLVMRVFREQRPLALDDVTRADPANAARLRPGGATSVLLSPITLGGERLGVLSAYADRPSSFEQDDLSLLTLFADEVAGLLQRRDLARSATAVRAQSEATRLKDEFLSAAAHDLRTPLTVVLAQAQLLARHMRRQQQATQDDLGGIDRLIVEAERMRRLTDDVLMAMLLVAHRFIVSEAYRELEQDHAAEELKRTESVLRADQHTLDLLLVDWAAWDDMYAFVESHSPAFIASNLPAELLTQLNLNALVIRDARGTTVIGLGRSPNGGPASIAGLTDTVPADSPLLKFGNEDHLSGIISTPMGPMIASSRPITMSDGSGTRRGTVVMARLLDQAYADRLAEMLLVEVSVHPLDAPDVPADVRDALLRDPNGPAPTRNIADNRIAAYAYLHDMNDRPVVILETDDIRTIEAESGQTLRAMLLTVGLTGVGLVIALVLTIQVTVVGRLRHLLDEMSSITGRGSSEGLRTHVTGRDEIGDVASGVNAMLDRLEQAAVDRVRLEQAVNEHERLAEEAFREVGEGLIVVDGAGVCTGSNPAALRILGISQDALIGQPLASVLPVLRPAEDATRSAGDQLFEIGRRSVAVSRSPGETPGKPSVVVLRDITDVREVERLKRDLVATVSHELRTPLTAIQATVSMLSEGDGGELTDMQHRLVELLDRNTDRLRVLVDDLLDMGALEGGRVTLNVVQADLTEICRSVVDEMHEAAEQAGVTIRTDFNDATVWGDHQRLRQVVENLVQNAVKFTPSGGWIEVSTHLWNRRATIVVRDTGIGIAAQEIDRIFEKFYRTSAGARYAHGTGLGLAITRSIVTLHGGRLTAESDGRSGTTMTVEIPADGLADA